MIQVCRDGKVWTTADARILREQHRIVCGTGCICRESSNKAPLCRLPLQLTAEQLYVGRVHGFIASTAPMTVSAEPMATQAVAGWWHTLWSVVTAFFQAPPEVDNRQAKRRKTDHDEHDTACVMDPQSMPPLRHRVFLDLWEKGLYVTSGSKFGGDFLIYDADPLTTHAKAIILVAESPIVTAPALAGFCRLAKAVKKSWVLAFAETNHAVSYTTLAHVTTTTRVPSSDAR